MRFAFDVACAVCGGDTRLVTNGEPVFGTQVSAVVHCEECDCEFQAMVRLLPVGRKAQNEMRRLTRV